MNISVENGLRTAAAIGAAVSAVSIDTPRNPQDVSLAPVTRSADNFLSQLPFQLVQLADLRIGSSTLEARGLSAVGSPCAVQIQLVVTNKGTNKPAEGVFYKINSAFGKGSVTTNKEGIGVDDTTNKPFVEIKGKSEVVRDGKDYMRYTWQVSGGPTSQPVEVICNSSTKLPITFEPQSVGTAPKPGETPKPAGFGNENQNNQIAQALDNMGKRMGEMEKTIQELKNPGAQKPEEKGEKPENKPENGQPGKPVDGGNADRGFFAPVVDAWNGFVGTLPWIAGTVIAGFALYKIGMRKVWDCVAGTVVAGGKMLWQWIAQKVAGNAQQNQGGNQQQNPAANAQQNTGNQGNP